MFKKLGEIIDTMVSIADNDEGWRGLTILLTLFLLILGAAVAAIMGIIFLIAFIASFNPAIAIALIVVGVLSLPVIAYVTSEQRKQQKNVR